MHAASPLRGEVRPIDGGRGGASGFLDGVGDMDVLRDFSGEGDGLGAIGVWSGTAGCLVAGRS